MAAGPVACIVAIAAMRRATLVSTLPLWAQASAKPWSCFQEEGTALGQRRRSGLAGHPTPSAAKDGPWDCGTRTPTPGVHAELCAHHPLCFPWSFTTGDLNSLPEPLGELGIHSINTELPQDKRAPGCNVTSSAESFLINVINHTFENSALSQTTRTQSMNQYFQKRLTEEAGGGSPRGGVGAHSSRDRVSLCSPCPGEGSRTVGMMQEEGAQGCIHKDWWDGFQC